MSKDDLIKQKWKEIVYLESQNRAKLFLTLVYVSSNLSFTLYSYDFDVPAEAWLLLRLAFAHAVVAEVLQVLGPRSIVI